jgi:hypothetical protein
MEWFALALYPTLIFWILSRHAFLLTAQSLKASHSCAAMGRVPGRNVAAKPEQYTMIKYIAREPYNT